MVEILVLGLCAGNFRCDMATKAYISETPQIRTWTNKEIKIVKEYTGESLFITTTTIFAIATKKTYQVKIYKNISFGKTPEGLLLIYAITF